MIEIGAGEVIFRREELGVTLLADIEQLAAEDEEEVAVGAMNVRRGAVAVRPEAGPCHDELVLVAENLDPSVRDVADDFALAGH